MRDEEYMRRSNLSENDILAYRSTRLSQWGLPGDTAMEQPSGQKALGQFLDVVGPAAGGVAASGLTARSGQLVQTLAEGTGIAAGDIGARAATGRPQNLKESAKLGAGGASIGYLFRGGTRLLGRMAGVPRYATEEAGVPTAGLPSYNKVGLIPGTSPGPRNVGQLFKGASAEESLADKARAAVGKLVSKYTPERLRKTQLLQQAGEAGAKVRLDPIISKLIDQEIPNPITDAARAHNAAIDRAFNELTDIYTKRKGSISPAELDEIIRRQLDPKAYTASGDPATSSIGTALREVRETAVKELNSALPPEVAKLNKAISEKLDMMDEAERLFGGDRSGVVNRIRNLYGPGAEDNIRALNFLAKETGDRTLKQRILNPLNKGQRTPLARGVQKAATKREFTEDIRTPSETRGRPFRTIVESGSKLGTRALAPLQPYVGPIAAGLYPEQTQQTGQYEMDALAALIQALNPRSNP